MIRVVTNPYRKWFFAGLVVLLIAAWFSVGYNHYDEHFQVMEFCNYKLGLSASSDLPWEFTTHCRPALQPFVAYCIARTLQNIGMYNPFSVAFLLRVIMAVLTWVVTCRMVLLLLPDLKTEKGRQLYVQLSFLLWFVPYIGVRFSAEHIAGVLFFLGLTIVPGILSTHGTKHYQRLMITGLLWGLVFCVRVQMGFAFLGLGLWVLFYRRWQWKEWFVICLFGLVAMGLSAVIDHWFYGEWVFTPFNYYKVNIMQHAAAKYGMSPWWYYFKLFFDYAIPPLSYVLLPMFILGMYKKPAHLFTWVCVAFIAGHCMISHKEMRFLIPIMFAFIYLVATFMDGLFVQYPENSVLKRGLTIVLFFNAVLLVGKIFIPAHEAVGYYKAIYDVARKQPTTLICYKESPYHIVGLEVNFYKPQNLDIKIVDSAGQVAQAISEAAGRTVLFMNPNMDPLSMFAPYEKEKVYCLLPDWIHYVNFGDWISRSYIWSIYRL